MIKIVSAQQAKLRKNYKNTRLKTFKKMQERFKCFNVIFLLLKTIYVHLLVCNLNKLQKAWCNDKVSSVI